MTGIVHVEVSGLTGSGKSAIMGEIEIALKALGLKVEHGPDFQAEKNATHADWQEALDLYQPTVVLIERNVSRQPEAHEEALGNLLAVIHGDGGHRALEVGTKQAALEAEKIVARLLSSAPEAREGEAVEWRWRIEGVDGWRRCGAAKPHFAASQPGNVVDLQALYTHPAAPSADKLRIAVEALGAEREWHERVANFAFDAAREASEQGEKSDEANAMGRMHAHNARVAILDQALAALKAEV